MDVSRGLESRCKRVGIKNLLWRQLSLKQYLLAYYRRHLSFPDSFLSIFIFDTLGIRKKDEMPISDCEVRDPRIRRTRQLLQGALRTLMQSKSFEDISVQDIAEAATVNRATFYDHYADKFALLDALVAGGFHQLLHAREVQFDGTCPSAAGAIIEATCDYLAQIRAEHPDCGAKDSAKNPFDPLIDAAITSAIRRVLTGLPGKPVVNGSPLSEMAATSAAWAIYGAARQWSFTPNRASVAEVVPQILTFILPMLQQAGQQSSPHTGPHTVDPASLASSSI